MVLEEYRSGPEPVYERFRARGRMMPAGLEYVDSWVALDRTRCWQLMRTDDRALFDAWIAAWSDLVDFQVIPVMTSAEAASQA